MHRKSEMKKATHTGVFTIFQIKNCNILLTYVIWWYFPVSIDDVCCLETDRLDFLYHGKTWYIIIRHTVGLRWYFTTFGYLKLYFWNYSTFCKLDIPLQTLIKVKNTVHVDIYPIVTWLNINKIAKSWTPF